MLVYSALFSDVCDILLSLDWLGNDEIYFNKNDQNHFFCQKYCQSAPLIVLVCALLYGKTTILPLAPHLRLYLPEPVHPDPNHPPLFPRRYSPAYFPYYPVLVLDSFTYLYNPTK